MGLRNLFFCDKICQHRLTGSLGTAYTVMSHIPEEQIPQRLFCCNTSLTANSQDFPPPPPHTHACTRTHTRAHTHASLHLLTHTDSLKYVSIFQSRWKNFMDKVPDLHGLYDEFVNMLQLLTVFHLQ
jgi:hypothetical protein